MSFEVDARSVTERNVCVATLDTRSALNENGPTKETAIITEERGPLTDSNQNTTVRGRNDHL